eukprot:TRINITY_DN5349_c0_g1_i1.p1 TRINITY_DN5349_c0_g1~~TRINITY_DN5349_c0_g1_i1.p1  ORF type:complete len:204 (+),score=16.15 TRINITY_DN5349_c0_g1_i1:189-800(+)
MCKHISKLKRITFTQSFSFFSNKVFWGLCTCVALTPLYASTIVVPPNEQLVLRKIQQQVSPARLKKDVTTLVGFGTRHTLSDTKSDTQGIGAARRWIKSEFDKISAQCGGCLEVIYQKQTFSGEKRIPEPTEVVNVIAIQRGQLDPNRYIIMSGDIDSRVTDPLDYTSPSPGANDNASGVAGVIEAARVLSQHKFAGTPCTLR